MPGMARRRRLWITAAAAVSITILGLAVRAYRDGTWRQKLERELYDSGGWYFDHAELEQGLRARTRYLLNPQWATREVMLRGAEFDDAWLRERDHLRALNLTQLQVHDTRITSTGLEGLLDGSSLVSFEFQNAPLSEATAEALSQQSRLTLLNLRGSALTDEQFATLSLDRIEHISVAETKVTSVALQQKLRTCEHLVLVGLDGQQCDEGLIQVLAEQGKVSHLQLYGPEVTDEHLERICRLQLRAVVLVNTGVTEPGIAVLKARHSACIVATMQRQRFLMEMNDVRQRY
jgi:hypothetical protein